MAEEEKEIWKEIDRWSDYKVSTFGNVMSCKFGKERILKPSISRGYRLVVLCKNNKTFSFSVHRLLALTFLPNYYGLPQVDHKDRNRQNNSIYNLRWVTQEDNMCNRDDYRTDIEELDPKKRKLIRDKQSRQKAKDEKKYYCNTCNIAFQCNHNLQRHYKTKTHLTKESI